MSDGNKADGKNKKNQGSKHRNNGAKNQQGKNQQGKNQQGKGQQQNGGGTRKRKKSRKKPRLDPVKYWGDPGALPVRNDYVLEGADPTAVVRSLGKAPIPGKNSAPELYFEVLYQRAAGLAHALSFAGGLNQDAPTPTQGPGDAEATDADAESAEASGD
jgi:hypothetical protein